MKDLIDKYKREPIVIAVVVGIVLYVLYLLISPYQKCMSLAPDKYYESGNVTSAWEQHKGRCITNTSY
jgi:hypothetical protein